GGGCGGGHCGGRRGGRGGSGDHFPNEAAGLHQVREDEALPAGRPKLDDSPQRQRHQWYPRGRDGSGQDPTEHQRSGLHARVQGHQRPAHHSRAQEHPVQLAQRAQALVPRAPPPPVPRHEGEF
ncbi:unnamed protein product, partial [Ectocarpus fasciculatus]